MYQLKNSFVELGARARAKAVLDDGTFMELLGPFDRMESPHLEPQDIVPESDDGIVIAKGLICGEPAVVISMEGAFQGGGIGEVSGSKFAGALELALLDNENGIPTRPVVLFDTGGVRLQEANYGLLSISEIQSAIVGLRKYVPIVGVIPGKIGCFGGMSMTAGLFTTLIVTREGRLTLNGPEVIEQEAGVAEFDAKDKQLIWNTLGGAQRVATGLADILVEDDIIEIVKAIHSTLISEKNSEPRSTKVDLYLSRLKAIDPTAPLNPIMLREMWGSDKDSTKAGSNFVKKEDINQEQFAQTTNRGRVWFEKLTGIRNPKTDTVSSVLCTDAMLGDETVRYIAVVPNSNSRFPRVRHGEVGLEEGWTIAKYVREAIKEDAGKEKPRPIIAIVDVPSQAYGYKEELLGIFLSCSSAVDAYATARYAGHPIIALIVGNAISGAFLAHGYQASRIIALDDPGVLVHAMSKESSARITKRSVAELEEAAKSVPSIAYDIKSFSTLGALHDLVSGINADVPTVDDTKKISNKLSDAISIARISPRDLRNRLTSKAALTGRAASIKVRTKLAKQWK
ncbi:biotin-independent malonate decarboxylase subunit beta [Clostridium estertheticum]|uniref:biotin-independent malonate decarboxylase subunit beta n=1 Tax=Clostridium estertheticum TaxID=238834 RepID=UPI001CF5BBCD|nr:biotin-independent malonate decarboxylase subunit beta [Clostridium estertheticum]MCB2308190.1 biotin-independent malonate decarboxylase subunit beta [Clostridium estertheticum]MCB2346231.1 biotin-independent malonate decarboxylase subunit beta [Clostridium estertheticum]MCB2349577.1 biotin-independent malonate decarboxylase subunit beta [Clostridium estertheticum]WAG46547.1 biotin-independent malonate decarboxylase subunit beta [Clostridium estertheticum]